MKTIELFCILLLQVGLLSAQESAPRDSVIVLESINGEKFQGIIVEENDKAIILQLKDSSNISLIKDELKGYRTIHDSYLSGYFGVGNNSSISCGLGFTLDNWSFLIDYLQSKSYSTMPYGRWEYASSTEYGRNLSALIGWRPHYEYFTIGLYTGLAMQTYEREVDHWFFFSSDSKSSSSSGTSLTVKSFLLYNPVDWFSVGLNYSYYLKPNLSNSYISLYMAFDLKTTN